jgi:hypothetical protein
MNQQQSCKTTKVLFSTQDSIKVRKETRTQTGAWLILSCSWYERGFRIESSWLMIQDLGRQCISSIPILMVIYQLLVASFRLHAQQWVLQWQFWIHRHNKGGDWNDWNCSNELKLAYFAETTSQHNLAVQRKAIKLGLHAKLGRVQMENVDHIPATLQNSSSGCGSETSVQPLIWASWDSGISVDPVMHSKIIKLKIGSNPCLGTKFHMSSSHEFAGLDWSKKLDPWVSELATCSSTSSHKTVNQLSSSWGGHIDRNSTWKTSTAKSLTACQLQFSLSLKSIQAILSAGSPISSLFFNKALLTLVYISFPFSVICIFLTSFSRRASAR